MSNREIINFTLTQLVKVRLDAVGSRHRADESGFEERAPLVHQTAVSAVVVLRGGMTRRSVMRPSKQPLDETQS